MFSHTVPKRLLEEFAYWEETTKSLRLWRYQKGQPPFPRASPKYATAHDGFFADTGNEKIEGEIETTLAHDVEDPVNAFLGDFSKPTFSLNEDQRKKVTRYITLLFNRSVSRRKGSEHTQQIIERSLETFLKNEVQVLTVAAQWSLQEYFAGRSGLIPVRAVAKAAKDVLAQGRTREAVQRNFVAQIRHVLTYFDENLFNGCWALITATPERPFIISDSPVVTWVRDENGLINHGFGFERPDVEVLLPVSPLTCLHIAPKVQRNRPVVSPSVVEIDHAQAVFARDACYTNVFSEEIDEIVQTTPKKQFGKDFFTLWHRNFDALFFEILMGREPPK